MKAAGAWVLAVGLLAGALGPGAAGAIGLRDGDGAPEITWERPFDKVVLDQRVGDLEVPRGLDDDFVIWKRFKNRYWPAMAMIDKRGTIRFVHVGEGAYTETEALIKTLLSEK